MNVNISAHIVISKPINHVGANNRLPLLYGYQLTTETRFFSQKILIAPLRYALEG
jgi:hypothetical protein